MANSNDRLPLRFRIEGMDCAEEVTVLKREIGPLVGGEDRLRFDILNARMTVTALPETVTEEVIVQAVSRLGMRAEKWREEAALARTESSWFRNRYTLLTVASGIFGGLGFVLHAVLSGGIQAALGSEGMGLAQSVPLAAMISYGLGILCGLWVVFPKAWVAAKRLRPDMNFLMTVAVLGAIAVGEWFEAATVSFLFSLSLALESWSVGRARRAVESLLELTPTLARIRQASGATLEVPPAEVPIGGIVLVNPGERLPLDGEVARGSSHVNQAPITGESEPVAKNPGDPVFAGTVNGNGALEIRTTKAAGETTLAHIIRLVGDAQSKRAPSEQWVEKFAQAYTPVVMLAALAVAVLPPLFVGNWPEWIYRGLVLLVIACPCALVISTPVTIVAALAAAARQGVLIKGGLHVETPARLKVFAFDKTGTLTEGKPRVVDVFPLNEHNERELLERAASLESHSDHPLAKAILVYAEEKGVTFRPAEEFRIIPGKGASGRFDGREFWLGSHRYLEEKGMETPEVHARLVELSEAGRSVVVIGNDKHVCGFLTVADAVRPAARGIVAELKKGGIEKVIMLSGDNKGTAQAVGKETGIDEVQAELLPADKVTAIESLVARFGSVGMVGDGVNDAPALARASVGIAMGAMGTDAAIETADIALMSDDLAKLPWLIQHSKRALRIIHQNITFSLAVKSLFVILTFAGFASMWAAIAADMGASLIVIFNGLRLLKE
jgi:Cd2+/Zn2+-exporting ATPase